MQLIHVGEDAKRIEQVFKANSAAMANVVPRSQENASRLLRVAYNSIAYDPKLLEISQTKAGMASIFGGVMEALKLGLLIGGPAQESWLIPFGKEVQLVIGYRGYRNIMDRAGAVLTCHPHAVYANDRFDCDLGANTITHKPYWLCGATETGEFVAAYIVFDLRGGGRQIEIMPAVEIEEHRARSRMGTSGAWKSDYVPMALKTVIRKGAKYVPMSSELLQRALDLDDKLDRGVPQDFDITALALDAPALPGAAVSSQTKLAALKSRLQESQPEPLPVVEAECLGAMAPEAHAPEPTAEEVARKAVEAMNVAPAEKEPPLEESPLMAFSDFGDGLEPNPPLETQQAIGQEKAAALLKEIKQRSGRG